MQHEHNVQGNLLTLPIEHLAHNALFNGRRKDAANVLYPLATSRQATHPFSTSMKSTSGLVSTLYRTCRHTGFNRQITIDCTNPSSSHPKNMPLRNRLHWAFSDFRKFQNVCKSSSHVYKGYCPYMYTTLRNFVVTVLWRFRNRW